MSKSINIGNRNIGFMYGEYHWNNPPLLKIKFNKDCFSWCIIFWKFGFYYTNWNKANRR